MPCRTDDYEPTTAHRSGIEEDRHTALERIRMKEELDLTTRLLCTIMSKIEGTSIYDALLHDVDDLADWWGKHKKADKERWKRDFEEALGKMTPNQREAIMKMIQGAF